MAVVQLHNNGSECLIRGCRQRVGVVGKSKGSKSKGSSLKKSKGSHEKQEVKSCIATFRYFRASLPTVA